MRFTEDTAVALIHDMCRERIARAEPARCDIEVVGEDAVIFLNCGEMAYIDADMAPRAAVFAWAYGGSRADNFYVRSCNWIACDKVKKYFFLHHLVLPRRKNLLVDHIDGDKLNNRRANLRLVPYRYNATNGKPRKRAGYDAPVGVTWDNQKGWRVRVNVGHYHNKHVGWFKTLEEASIVAREVHLKAHGKYSVYNRKGM